MTGRWKTSWPGKGPWRVRGGRRSHGGTAEGPKATCGPVRAGTCGVCTPTCAHWCA